MLTIPEHKGKANQNYTKTPSTSLFSELLPSRIPPKPNVGKDVGEKEASYTAGGDVS
jgi:hypothetical protein